jgi:4-hydroxybenzoate polyprenyltransferase
VLAGAPPGAAIRLALAMVSLQAAIGAANDLIDAPRDKGRKPGKPIPSGLVSRPHARTVAVAAAIAGLILSLPSGLPTVAVAALILAIGLLYDLRLRGTAWSWLPFALGIPLLPVFAWLGGTGRLPGLFAILLPAGFGAGTALAIANALADVERDRSSGSSSVADRLGLTMAWVVHAVLQVLVVAAALASLAGAGARVGPAGVALVISLAGAGGIVAGVILARSIRPSARERGWELEAVGVTVLAVGWVLGMAPLAG